MKVFLCLFVLILFVNISLTLDLNINNKEDVRLFLENNEMLKTFAGRKGHREVTKQDLDGPTLWFDQQLDHFTYSNVTWKQRYVVNSTFYKAGGPVFFFLDGEAAMQFFDFQEVFPFELCQQFGALYISLEHRYYGRSLPFDKFTDENMVYLSSQQALADAANFIDYYNSTLEGAPQWVVWGCSYSGALSAWFRAKYPNSVVAAIAPSGPVLAKTNYTEYYNQFQLSAPDDCVNAVSQGVIQINNMIAQPNGLEQLATIFNACKPIDPNEIWYFKFLLTENVGGADQFDNPPDFPLNDTCKTMTASTNYIQNWANTFDTTTCNDFSVENYVKLMKITIPNANRAWYWQKCNEFGFFKTSYPGTSVFFDDIPLEPMVQSCQAIFGYPNMTPNTEFTNTFYGGLDLIATNVMFSNGNLDPWHRLSINKSFPDGSVQAVTYDAGHCATMDASTNVDEPSLIQARKEIAQFLEKILN
eukprot:TRINITY_DN15195_c0_g1_i1.p1 TRINITY_DN15195_c0_g1~~TRINITY_DN15195_c0_g1_i1.p1  ORF type:complete len:473 (+),score=165.90 TRINITY_DN15195_c0_g1_i1:1475-2893(+)